MRSVWKITTMLISYKLRKISGWEPRCLTKILML